MKLVLDGAWLIENRRGQRIEAHVPGSVYGNLLAAGLIEDPYWRDNEEDFYGICEDDYTFSRKFTADGNLIARDEAELVFQGIDTLARVYVNGRLAGVAENMHRSYRFPVKELLVEGENSLRVEISSPVRHAREMDMKNPLWGAGHTMPGYQHIRKGHYMFGWDWGPILPDMGIWKSVYIEARDTAAIEDVIFRQGHGENRVVLTAGVGIRRLADAALTAEMRITCPDGSVIRKEAAVAGVACVLEAVIENPSLWWPNGYGSQHLYKVGISLRAGAECDSKEYEIGLRTIRLNTARDKWGREFTFVVNGVKIFAMGANYIPQDNLLDRVTPERTERLVKDCADANFNMLRVWGGGLYAGDDLLSSCDRHGILLWQDFMFACALYDLTDSFRENIMREFEDNIKRMRHHACLALWCGNNEIETGIANWSIPRNEKLRADYIEIFERMIPETLNKFDPGCNYWPSSPSSYGGFDRPGDPDHGDTHYWDVWHGMKPFEDYKNHYFRFCSEFGFQSFPSMKTIESYTLPEDRNIFSYVMERHQKNTSANGKIAVYLAANYRYPRDLRQLVYASQLLQAEAISFGVRHMRRNRGRCMGALYWQVNDCWPVASWASIDYYGRWKALHYAAKRFFAPVLLSADEQDGRVALSVSNERRTAFSGTVRWNLRDNSGFAILGGSAGVKIGPLEAREVAAVDLSPELSDKRRRMNSYLEFELLEDGHAVSRGTYIFIKAKHYNFMNPEISFEVTDRGNEFEIRLRSKAYARFVELSITGADAVFSDNYFDLVPGREEVVTIKKDRISHALSAEEISGRLEVNSVYDIS